MYDTLKRESKMNEFCIERECCVQNGGPKKKNNMISFRLQYANEIKAEFPSEQERTCFCCTATLSAPIQRLVVQEAVVVMAVVVVEVVAAASVVAVVVATVVLATVKVLLGLGCSLFG